MLVSGQTFPAYTVDVLRHGSWDALPVFHERPIEFVRLFAKECLRTSEDIKAVRIYGLLFNQGDSGTEDPLYDFAHRTLCEEMTRQEEGGAK